MRLPFTGLRREAKPITKFPPDSEHYEMGELKYIVNDVEVSREEFARRVGLHSVDHGPHAPDTDC